MIDIIVHRRFRKYKATIPEAWHELTAKQLLVISTVLLSNDDIYTCKLRLLCVLTNWPVYRFKGCSADEMLNTLLPLTDFISESCDLTTQLLPRLGKYHGPKDHLRNLVMVEFDFAERELYAWHQLTDQKDTAAIKSLYRFIACLYRRPKANYDVVLDPDGDIRETFNANTIEYHAAILQDQIPVTTAFAIVLFYKGCRQYINNRYPKIFKDGDGEANDYPTYFKLIRNLAEKGTYGAFDAVSHLPIYNAFEELECCLQDQADLKKPTEKL